MTVFSASIQRPWRIRNWTIGGYVGSTNHTVDCLQSAFSHEIHSFLNIVIIASVVANNDTNKDDNKRLQSSQVKCTPQDSIIEFIAQKAESIGSCRFQVHLCILVMYA